jgi:hypothetical protein
MDNTTTVIKERKPQLRSNKDTQTMTRKDQVVISRLRTGYCRATHAAIINRVPIPGCPFCGVPLTIDHLLWQCEETKEEMTNFPGKNCPIKNCPRKNCLGKNCLEKNCPGKKNSWERINQGRIAVEKNCRGRIVCGRIVWGRTDSKSF